MSPAAHLSRWPLLVVTMLLGLLAPMLLAVPNADAAHVAPVVYAGNPHCDDLIPADDYLFVLNDVPPITQVIPLSNGDLTGTLSITVSSDGKTFDFSLTGAFGVSAVAVKGGPNVNLYDYRGLGGEVADTGLRSPLQNASLPGLSHMDFCFVELNPSTTLSLTTEGLDVPGVSSYDASTNTLTVLEGSSVSLDAVETNDGNVALTDTYVLFDGVACAGGNQKDGPASLLPDEDFTGTCDFNAVVGETTVTVTGHGAYGGKDVTWCADESDPPADTICDQDERDEITIVGINPSTDLGLSAWDSSPGSGSMTGSDPETWTIHVDHGGDVDLTFTESNDGTEPTDVLNDVYIAFTGAAECTDAGVATLAAGADHTVVCDTIEDITTDMTITAIGHGTDALGNDVTWCEPDDLVDPPAGVTCDQDEKVVVEIVVDTPSTSLSLDTSALDVAGVADYDETTNTLTVFAGSPVTLDATETNDGEVDLIDAHVVFEGVTCAGGNQQPFPGVALAVDGELDVACTFNAALGETTVTLTGHGTDRLGNDVTWCADPTAAPDATFCDQDERDEITIVGINPSTELSLTSFGATPGDGSMTGTDPETWTINVDYGGSVDLTFTETNDGTEPDDVLSDVHIEFVGGAPECTDAGVASLLPGETHVVTCDTIQDITASRTIEAIGHGTTVLGTDVTWCSDPVLAPYGVTCDQDEKVVVSIVVNFGEGCTPGLWRQYDNMLGKGRKATYHWIRGEWAASPYSYSDNAGTVFGVAAWDDYTLGELTQLGGGGMNALGRHAAAALQNIMHPDIDYFDYATGDAAGLIADVQAAVAAGDAEVEALHIRLADFNDQGTCELSKN